MSQKETTLIKKKAYGKKFSSLYKSMTQQGTKLVLALGGGGVRMAAHIPVFEFLESMGVMGHISEIWGTSGGAFVGLPFSRGMSSKEIESFVKDIFLGGRVKAQLRPSLLTVAKIIARESLFSSDLERDIEGFHDHIVFQEEGRKALEGYQQKIPFYCLAYNLTTHQTEALTPSPVPADVYNGWMFQADAFDAVAASAAVPIVFKPKVIKDQAGTDHIYVDGATNEEVPTITVRKKWLCDHEVGIENRRRLLVIGVSLNAQFTTMGFFKNRIFRKIPIIQHVRSTMYYSDLIRQAKLADQKRVLIADPSIELWDIDLKLQGDMLDPKGIPDLIAYAKKEVPRQLAAINDSLLI